MSSPNDFPAGEKKAFIYEIGANLVNRYGRKQFYRPQEVVIAFNLSSFKDRNSPSWAICVFCSQQGFESYHKSIAPPCNYELMKVTMRNDQHKQEAPRPTESAAIIPEDVSDTLEIVATFGEFIAEFFH